MLNCPDLNFVSLMPVVLVRACSTSASFGTYPDAPIRLISSKKLQGTRKSLARDSSPSSSSKTHYGAESIK
jgi:hypothetical protein